MQLKISLSIGTKTEYDVLTEINIIKKLDHPHIVKLYEVIEDEKKQKLYLIMDFMKKGQVMGKRYWKSFKVEDSKHKTISLEKSRKYFRQLAKAIDYRKTRL